jgi:hypothetical protein
MGLNRRMSGKTIATTTACTTRKLDGAEAVTAMRRTCSIKINWMNGRRNHEAGGGVMPDIEVNIELYCAGCGAGLCANGTATTRRHHPCFDIEPCQKCLEKADDSGYERGRNEDKEA